MTIRFLKQWNGYSPDAIVTLAGAEETRLVNLGFASFDLDGDAEAEFFVKGKTNPLTEGVEVSVAGRILPLPMQTTGLTVQNGRLYMNGSYCRELGLNAFSLVQTQLATPTSTEYQSIIDGAVAMNVRVIRFAMTPLTAADIIAQMHGGSLAIPVGWSSLSQSYRDAVQTVFDYAASKGVYLIPTIIWTKSAVAQAFSETPTTAAVDVKSKTRQYMRAFTAAFVNQYKGHAALGAYNPVNEPSLVSGTYLTTTQAREILSEVASIVRQIDPAHAILSGSLDFIYDGLTTRPLFNAAVSTFVANNIDPCDTLDVHAYSDRAWIGKDVANTLDSLTNEAFTFAKEWFIRLRHAGHAAGKPFVMSEIGVKGRISTNGQETLGETTKFDALLDAVYQSGVQLALIWNYRNSTVAGQDVWDISEGTARGDAYIPLIKSYAGMMRSSQPMDATAPLFDAAATKFPLPATCASFTGGANVAIIYPGDAAFSGTSGSVLGWFKKTAPADAFDRVIGAQNSGGTEGWNLLYDGAGGELGLSLRKADNTEARNTFGKLPAVAVGEWAFHGFTWDASTRIDCYLHGLWFDKQNTAYTYAGKGASVGLRIGTSHAGANGFNGSVAGLVIVNRVCTAREVADYYLYGKVPSGGVVFPFSGDGITIGAAAITPTSVDAAVTFGASA